MLSCLVAPPWTWACVGRDICDAESDTDVSAGYQEASMCEMYCATVLHSHDDAALLYGPQNQNKMASQCMGQGAWLFCCWWYRLLTGLAQPADDFQGLCPSGRPAYPLFVYARDSILGLSLLGRSTSCLTPLSSFPSYGLPCVGSNSPLRS